MIGIGTLSSRSFGAATAKRTALPKKLPVINDVEICVLGGSCTGTFAAVRAARLGARVAIVEKQNAFGGVATNALVNVWHTLYDTEFKRQIIAGLTEETIERLSRRQAILHTSKSPSSAYRFNSQELKIELDELIMESGITPYLHTLFSEPVLDNDGRLTGKIFKETFFSGQEFF